MIYFLKIWYKIKQYPHLICKQYNILRIMNTATSSWRENALRYFSADITWYLFQERSSTQTVSLVEQIMSGQISEHISMSTGGYCVQYPLNIMIAFAAWAVHFSVFTGTTLRANECFAHQSQIKFWRNNFFCRGRKIWKEGNITWGLSPNSCN